MCDYHQIVEYSMGLDTVQSNFNQGLYGVRGRGEASFK